MLLFAMPPSAALPETEFQVKGPAERSPRVLRLLQAPTADSPGSVSITRRKKTEIYVFKEVACDIGGRGFAVHRLGLGNLYHVRIGTRTQSSCECLGYLRHGHCKHIQGLAALIGHKLV